MIQTDITGLADLLRQLRQADTNFRVFGADSHHYELRPTLNEAQIAEFESIHHIQLPEDYRQFLQEIGDGGAGPYYGLFSLQQTISESDLSQPFPLTQALEDVSSDEGHEIYTEHAMYRGLLELCHQGCAFYSFLVVNGPTYGLVWNGIEGFYPTHLSFSQWYKQWAQRALQLLGNDHLVARLAPGMTKAQVVEVTGAQWKERKNLYADEYYFETSEIAAQLILTGEDGVVKEVRRWPFI